MLLVYLSSGAVYQPTPLKTHEHISLSRLMNPSESLLLPAPFPLPLPHPLLPLPLPLPSLPQHPHQPPNPLSRPHHDPDPQHATNLPHPPRPNQHRRENHSGLKPLHQRGFHCEACQFPLGFVAGSYGGGIEEDEVVDVERGFEEGDCEKGRGGDGERLAIGNADGEEGVDDKIGQKVEKAA